LTNDRNVRGSGARAFSPVPRQRQVLQGAADGLTAGQVARQLGISRRTAEGHLRTLRELTGTRSVAQLCALGVAEGWVTSHRPAGGPPMWEADCEPGMSRLGFRTDRFPDRPLDRRPPGRRARGGRPTVMTPERIAAARELWPAYRVTEIARKLGVSRSTLYAHMDAISAPARTRSEPLTAPR